MTMTLRHQRAIRLEALPERGMNARGKTLLGTSHAVDGIAEALPLALRAQNLERCCDDQTPCRHDIMSALRRLPSDPRSCTLVEASALARRASKRILARAEAKDVDVVVYCTTGRVRVHEQAFADALHELLDNAVNATSRGYPVILTARDTNQGDVLWQVQDVGTGMSEKALAELGQARETGRAGNGFGVLFAWAVIESHGGLLRFESEPGFGTTASIWLPERSRGD